LILLQPHSGCTASLFAPQRAIDPPDLNPIEMRFGQLKAYLRSASERTISRLRRRIGLFARNLTACQAPIISGTHGKSKIDQIKQQTKALEF